MSRRSKLRHLVVLIPLMLPTLAHAFTYQIDDGTSERNVAPPRGRTLAWLNSFQVAPSAQTLTSIDLTLFEEAAYPVDIYLWTDPTNDANPVDAVVARSVRISTGEDGFIRVPFEPITLPAESWFFAGGIYKQPADAPLVYYPASIDETAPAFVDRSYTSLWLEGATADPNDLSSNALFFRAEADGNYLVRVNAVPEPTTLAMLSLAIVTFGACARIWQ